MRYGLIGLAGVLVFATLAIAGCGDEAEGGGSGAEMVVAASSCTKAAGGTVVTNLCGSVALNTLTDEEKLQLCTDTGMYLASSITRTTGCHYFGIISAASNSSPTVAELQTACTNSEGSCNQDASVAGPGQNTLCGQVPATCTATIEQYSTCVMDEAVLFDQGASALVSCSMLTFENLSAAYDVPTAAAAAPSCTAIKTACPNFSLPYIN